MVRSPRKLHSCLVVCGLFLLKFIYVSGDSCEKVAFKGEDRHKFARGDGKPNRFYNIYTPKNYVASEGKTKVIFGFHGYSDSGKYYTHPEGRYKKRTAKFLELADKYNYAIVGFDGITGLGGEDGVSDHEIYRSFTSGGTSTGLTPDGEPTCDLTMEWNKPEKVVDGCYTSQCECANRCGYSHCGDDDIQMIADFINSGELSKKLCYDEDAIFATGNSNGGIFTWNLGQDERTAKLFAGIAPTIAAPVCGYDFKTNKASVPAISFVGTKDPTHPVYQKKPKTKCVQSSKYEGGYRFVSSHQITTVWAKGEPGCDVADENEFPTRNFEFKGLTKLTCRTWCEGNAPFSLDCFYKAKHDDMPKNDPFAYEAAMMFFDSHLDASLDRKSLR